MTSVIKLSEVPIKSLRQQLEVMSRMRKAGNPKYRESVRFFGMEDLLLQAGTAYRPCELPKDNKLPHYPSACFRNAYQAAVRHNSPWIYTEGYGIKPDTGIPVHHAWLTRTNAPGMAFDPTWENPVKERAAYIGVPFRPEFVLAMRRSSRNLWFGVIDAFWDQWPLYTGKIRLEDVIHEQHLT